MSLCFELGCTAGSAVLISSGNPCPADTANPRRTVGAHGPALVEVLVAYPPPAFGAPIEMESCIRLRFQPGLSGIFCLKGRCSVAMLADSAKEGKPAAAPLTKNPALGSKCRIRLMSHQSFAPPFPDFFAFLASFPPEMRQAYGVRHRPAPELRPSLPRAAGPADFPA